MRSLRAAATTSVRAAPLCRLLPLLSFCVSCNAELHRSGWRLRCRRWRRVEQRCARSSFALCRLHCRCSLMRCVANGDYAFVGAGFANTGQCAGGRLHCRVMPNLLHRSGWLLRCRRWRRGKRWCARSLHCRCSLMMQCAADGNYAFVGAGFENTGQCALALFCVCRVMPNLLHRSGWRLRCRRWRLRKLWCERGDIPPVRAFVRSRCDARRAVMQPTPSTPSLALARRITVRPVIFMSVATRLTTAAAALAVVAGADNAFIGAGYENYSFVSLLALARDASTIIFAH